MSAACAGAHIIAAYAGKQNADFCNASDSTVVKGNAHSMVKTGSFPSLCFVDVLKASS
jgi:hypothetical protein